MAENHKTSETDPLFLSLLLSMEMSAMQSLGKMINPASGKVERDLKQAQMAIDMVAMLEKKTSGNRSQDETELTQKILYQLRLNYLDELESEKKHPPENAPQEPEQESGEAPKA